MNCFRLRLVSTLTFGIGFALFTGLARVNAAVIFVNADAIGNDDGTSWENAFPDLQDALAASDGGDQIWVATATYRPAGPGGGRTATFQLINGVAIYGGFTGDERELDQRDPVVNVTVLSGDLNGDDGEDFANNDENSYHVVTASDTDATAVLDGFTISGGNAYGAAQNVGGGLFMENGSPVLVNCSVTGNDSPIAGGAYASDGSPSFDNCAFLGNGVYGFYSLHSDTNLVNCRFENQTWSAFFVTGGFVTVTGCQFNNNGATYNLRGGAMDIATNATLVVLDCTFANNVIDDFGGAIYNEGDLTITNSVFTGNSASEGAAIWNNGDLRVTNCTLSDNSAGRGAGIFSNCEVVIVDNSLFWGNVAGFGTLEEQQIRLFSACPGELIINDTIVEGWTGDWGGEGNSGDDPQFLEGTQQPMHGSPAIDTGNDDAVPPGIETDIVGNPRFVDGDGDKNSTVDLGAYEFQPACEGDANGDGLVDPLDSGFVLARFGCPVGTGDPFCDTADQNGDGVVDPLDVGFVLARFGTCH